MFISNEIINEILRVIGNSPIESGGIIGCKNDCICAFVFDNQRTSSNEYRPNVEYLNSEINKWNAKGITFCGIVHSHQYGFNSPSESDKIYAKRLLKYGTNIHELFFPIITVNSFGKYEIDFYRFLPQKDDFIKIELQLSEN